MSTQLERLKTAYDTLRGCGKIHTQKDFAALLGYTRSSISLALAGNPSYLTEKLVSKAEAAASIAAPREGAQAEPDIVIPAATAKMYADMAESIRILSELVAAQQKGAGSKESPAASGF